jgi:uncharacterized protein (TIGR03118 family)
VVLLAGISLVRADPEDIYQATILVSNEKGVGTVGTDPKLVNAWGIAASATSPWWVADNGSFFSTVYQGTGAKASIEVSTPGPSTGIVAYGGQAFLLAMNRPARFLFAAEDGTISGWNPQFDAQHAHVLFTGPGAVYKGLANISDTLYASDFGNCKVQAVNGAFGAFDTAGGFVDHTIPDDYCPFGIAAIGGSLFVTYALRGGLDDIAGVSHGFVREFDVNGNLVADVANHGTLNSPWGMAMAPSDFGRYSGCLLVGNFGDGLINAYCEEQPGQFQPRGRLKDHGHDIKIDGLWGLGFGNDRASGPHNVLYFAAGPDGESNGYFGKIQFIDNGQ